MRLGLSLCGGRNRGARVLLWFSILQPLSQKGPKQSDNRGTNAPALRFARVNDASVGACVYQKKVDNNKTETQSISKTNKKRDREEANANLGPFYRECIHVHDIEPACE